LKRPTVPKKNETGRKFENETLRNTPTEDGSDQEFVSPIII